MDPGAARDEDHPGACDPLQLKLTCMSYKMNPIENDADGAMVVRFLYRNRKIYLIVLIISVIAGVIFSALMKPKYNSSAIVFPVQSNLIESVIDNPVFGYDVEADRLLQILYSEEVLDSCAVKFDLYNRWGIDPALAESREELKEEFYRYVSFSRSQYVSIIISATTTEPQLCADMVNYIITLSDGIRNRIYKRNLFIVYQSLEKEYSERRNNLDRMTDSVAVLRNATSVEVLTLMNNQVVLKNNSLSNSEEQTDLERLLNNYLYEQSQVNDLSGRYLRAKTQYERPTTQTFVLQYAKPSFKKRSPDFKINILVTVACSLLFLTGFLMLRDKLSTIRFRD